MSALVALGSFSLLCLLAWLQCRAILKRRDSGPIGLTGRAPHRTRSTGSPDANPPWASSRLAKNGSRPVSPRHSRRGGRDFLLAWFLPLKPGWSRGNGSRPVEGARFFYVTEKGLRKRQEREAHMSIWPTSKRRVRRVS